MSTTVDNRVLEMRFDNKQFENGVATSMSTLEKLKQKLNLTGASKGLEGINNAAKNIKFDGMLSGIDTVTSKFSYMQMTIQHQLDRIVDSCVDAGKRMVSALTIDPVKSGFQEYETQINAVQTILANVGHKGKTLDDVNMALDELNKYADQTIYNFTEMTRNIGLFTNAGVGLDESVSAIKGFSNAAAMAGTDATRTAGAMYQLSQAMSTGKVQLMDWRSLEQANITGERFQETIKETARAHGIAIDSMIKEEGSLRDTLSKGWLTADLMAEALEHYTLSTETMTEAEQEAARAKMKSNGYTDEQIDKLFELGTEATSAATKVKTFTQLIDTLKESLQSGWTQTWEILIGDFEEAKELFTGISEFLGGIIEKSSETRNTILEGAMTSGWDKLTDKINEAGVSTEDFEQKVIDLGRSRGLNMDRLIKDYGSLEEAVQAGAVSTDILRKALESLKGGISGFDLEGIFKFGDGLDEPSGEVEKLQQALVDAGFELEKFGVDGKFGKETQEAVKAFQEAHGLVADGIVGPDTLAALEEATGKTGELIDEIYALCDGVTTLGGRQNIIEGFKNIWEALKEVFGAVGDAWQQVFPPSSLEERITKVNGMTLAFSEFTKKLIPSEETADKLKRTFAGLFAALDLIKTVIGGGLGAAFKILSSILGAFDVDILSVTANIGDTIVAFRKWFLEGNVLAKAINGLIDKLPVLINKFKTWFTVFKETPAVQKFVDAIMTIVDAFKNLGKSVEIDGVFKKFSVEDLATSLGEGLANALKAIPGIAVQIGKDVIAGFQNGISDSVGGVIDKIISFCSNFISAFASALGVQSPSVLAFAIGAFVILGFINGFKSMFPDSFAAIADFGKNIISKIKDSLGPVGDVLYGLFGGVYDMLVDESGKIKWDKIFSIGSTVAAVVFGKKVLGIFENLTDPLGGVSEILENFANNLPMLMRNVGKAIKGLGSMFKGIGFEYRTEGIKNLAIALLMLVGAVAVITLLDPDRLWEAVGVIGVLVAIVAALAISTSLLSGSSIDLQKGSASIKGLKPSLAKIAAAILMVAIAVKMLGDMGEDEIKQGLISVAAIAGGLFIFATALNFLTKGNLGANADKVGKMMSKLAVAMLLMIGVIKLSGTITEEEAIKAAAFALAFGIFVVAITKVAKSAGNNVGKVGGMILKITIAMWLMVGVVRLINSLSWDAMIKGAAFAAGFAAFVWALVQATKIGKKQQLAKLTGLILSVSVGLLAMAAVCWIVGYMRPEAFEQGIYGVTIFTTLIAGLIYVVKRFGSDASKLAGTLIAFSVAIVVLAGVTFLLGQMNPVAMKQGLAAISVLAVIMYVLIKATENASDAKGNIVAISIAVGILAVSIAALSMLDPTSLIAPTIALGVLMGMFALIAKSSKDLNGSLGPLIVMTVAIGIMALALAGLSMLDPTSLIAPTVALGALMLAFTRMMKSLQNASISIVPLIALTAVIAVFAGILYLLRDLDPKSALSAVAGISVLMAALVIAMKSLSKGPGLGVQSIIGIAVLTAVIAVLGFVISQLKDIDPASAIGGAVGIAILLASLVGVLYLCSGLAAVAGPALIGAVVLGAFMIILAGVIWVIAQIAKDIISDMPEMATDLSEFMTNLKPFLEGAANIPDGLLGKLSSLGAGIAVLGLGSFITSLLNLLSNFLGMSMPQLATELSNFMINLQPFLSLSNLIPDGLLGKLTSLGAGMAVLGLGQFVSAVVNLLMNLLGTSMPQLATELSGFMINLQPFLLGSMLIPDGIAGKLTALSAGMVAIGIGQCITAFTNLISNLLGTGMPQLAAELSGFMINLQPFLLGSSLIPDGIAGKLTSLSAGMVAIGIGQCITAFTNLLSNFLGTSMPQLGSELSGFMTNLIPFLVGSMLIPEGIAGKLTALSAGMVAIGIGQCITALTNMLSNFMGTGMPQLGSELSGFMTNLTPFFTGILSVPDDIENKAKLLSNAMIAIGTGNALSAITNLISEIMGQDLPTLGSDLGGFMTNLMPFLIGSMLIPDDIATKVSLLTEAIGDLTTENFWKNIKEFFSGGDKASLANLGTELNALGTGLASFSTSANSFSVSSESITSITDFIETMGEVDSSAMTNMDKLSDSITKFGTAVSEFAVTTGDMNTGGISTAISTAYRLKNLIGTLSDIDFSGVADFTGIGAGAGHGGAGADGLVSDIGKAIAGFSKEVSGIDVSAIDTSVSAALRLKMLISGLSGLDTGGIENFKVDSIGESMKTYSDKVADIDTTKVSSSVSSAIKLRNFISSLAGFDKSGLSSFRPASLGSSLKLYSDNVSGLNMESISSSISAATKLKNFITSLSGIDTSGVSSFKSAMSSLGKTNVSDFTKAFSGSTKNLSSIGSDMISSIKSGLSSSSSSLSSTASSIMSSMTKAIGNKKGDFKSAGETLMTSLSSGLSSQKSKVSSTVSTTVSSAATGVKNNRSSFYSAGTYLGDGLVSGINAKKTDAYNAGYALGQAAVQGEKAGQQSQSPSKLTIQAGKWLGEGLVIGIEKMWRKVYNAGHNLGDSAANSMSKAISKVSDLINGGMDSQPTIRPVLDLSDVQSGVGAVNGMFSDGLTIGTSANLGAISTMMNRRNQNGTNDEVVSAINKLRKGLENVGNTSYNINGITYDDGSNVSSAVQALIREARVERRR